MDEALAHLNEVRKILVSIQRWEFVSRLDVIINEIEGTATEPMG